MGLRLSIFGSQQAESQVPIGVLGTKEARESAQEAPQVAKKAFGQVGGLQAIAPRPQPLPGAAESHAAGVDALNSSPLPARGDSRSATPRYQPLQHGSTLAV
ncbi:MAG: hypothetical protein ACRD1O_07860 [Terriglobia bacterium]